MEALSLNINIILFGNPVSAYRFVENNAAIKAQYMMNKLLEFRSSEKVTNNIWEF